MTKVKHKRHEIIVTTSSSGAWGILGLLAIFAFLGFLAHNRIKTLHQDLFNAEAPMSYSFDFGDFAVVAQARVTSQPRSDINRWKELPFISEPQTYRVTHKISLFKHWGTIELKMSDNRADFLNSDVIINFQTDSNEVRFQVPPFKYNAQAFRLSLGDLHGFFSPNGTIKLNFKEIELKMVNHSFRLSDVVVEVPYDRKSIVILASKIHLEDAFLDSSKLVFMGTNPFEIKLNSSFKTAPVELHWTIQKSELLGQEVQIGSGKLRFPASLIDEYVGPKVDRLLITKQKEVESAGSEKARFLFSAAKEVSRAEARSIALRELAPGIVQRDGEFLVVNVEKQDAFQIAEKKLLRANQRRDYLKSWLALDKEGMIEEAYFALIFGDNNRALAVKELIESKKKELKNDPLFEALVIRSALRDSRINEDDYGPAKLEAIEKQVPDVVRALGDHKFATLLLLDIARARKDRPTASALTTEYLKKEEDTQLQAMFSFLNLLHSDYAAALATLEKAHSLNPKSLYVQNIVRHRIHVYQHSGETDKLESEFKLLLANSSPEPVDLVIFGNILKARKELDRALTTVSKCLELDPVNLQCHELRESVMTLIAYEKQKENHDAAIEYLQNALVDRPASVPVNTGLGHLYRLKGEPDKSINHYSIACALEDSFACVEAGDYLSKNGDQERALLLFDVSCDLKSGIGCLKAGLFAERTGKLDSSGEYFDRACNQLNDNVACYHLARNLQQKQAANKEILPYLNRACKIYGSACKLASVYQSSTKQPPIPLEPK